MKKILLMAACWAACPAAFAVTCTPPASGDWTLGADCTYTSCGYRVAGNVNVGNYVLTLNPSAPACVMGVDLSSKTVTFGASGKVVMSGAQRVQATLGAGHSYHWSTGAFGSCSVGCGNGTQSRAVTCVTDWDGSAAPDAMCTGVKPAASQVCWAGYCSWATGGWGACSASCGAGSQSRAVWCTGGAVTDCDAGAKPAVSQGCNNGPCCGWEDRGTSGAQITNVQYDTTGCVNVASFTCGVPFTSCPVASNCGPGQKSYKRYTNVPLNGCSMFNPGQFKLYLNSTSPSTVFSGGDVTWGSFKYTPLPYPNGVYNTNLMGPLGNFVNSMNVQEYVCH